MNIHLNCKDDYEINMAALRCIEKYRFSEEICDFAERFFNLAKVLTKGGFIGMQTNFNRDYSLKRFAFSSRDIRVKKDDFEWLFRKDNVLLVRPGRLKGLLKGSRKVYVLKPDENALETDGIMISWDGLREYAAYDMPTALSKLDATIRTIAEYDDEHKMVHGTACISLAEEMPFYLKCMLGKIMPGFKFEEAQNDGHCDEVITDTWLAACLSVFFQIAFLKSDSETPEKADESPAEYEGSVLDSDFDFEGGYEFVIDDDEWGDPSDKATETEQESVDHMAQLDALIGLADVKEQVKRIAAFAKMKKALYDAGKPVPNISLNMAFIGNPGTAKTTVARIIAGIFHDLGILSSGEVVEVGRSELVGKYSGHTAGKVKDVFSRSNGKLLFIDEAYSLVDGFGSSFGDEAINAIVQEMENRRKNTVVVFAGYPDKMKSFIDRNPGLRSRVPFQISFPDYAPNEMARIAAFEAERQGFTIEAEAMDKIESICGPVCGKQDASNGRFCRNLVENAILEYAVRTFGEDGAAADVSLLLVASDFVIPKDARRDNKARLGFTA